MAVKRIQWVCPNCRRRYAIPEDAPTPKLCPDCQTAPPPTAAEDPRAAVPEPGPESVTPPSPLGPEQFQFEEPGSSAVQFADRSRSSGRKRYPALRAISFWYKILSGLAAVGAVFGLFYAVMAAVSTEATAERTNQIVGGLIALAGGLVSAVTLLACAELIRVVIDIEENTRSK